MPLKTLLISRFGDGADYAIDARRDGHECKVWIEDPKRRHTVYEGLVDKVEDYKDALEWADFVFFDANHLEKHWEVCSKVKPCWNGSPEGNKMEDDRSYARDLFEKYGMKRLASDTFKKIEEAIKFIQSKNGLKVGKVFGGDSDSEDVCISERESGDDLIEILQRYSDSDKKYDGVEIEDRVLGIEMGCASYYSKGVRCGPIELNWQHKEPADGWPGSERGLGALCGESGTLARYVEEDNYFYQKTLALFNDFLKKIKFTGEIDLGCMVNEKGITPIEFTPGRPGYPDSFLRRALSKTSQMEFFYSCVKGKPIPYESLPGWGICFLLMASGFPDQKSVEKRSAGYPVIGYDEKNVNMHLQEVTKENGKIVVARGQGYAAVVSGRGDTIESSRRNAHWLVHESNKKRLYIPKAQIRADIGMRVLQQKDEILELGLMSPEEWEGEAVPA
jgi:phosphoribosylamine--glycine ligase